MTEMTGEFFDGTRERLCHGCCQLRRQRFSKIYFLGVSRIRSRGAGVLLGQGRGGA